MDAIFYRCAAQVPRMAINFRLREKLLKREPLNWMETLVAVLIVAVALVVGLTFGLVLLGLAAVLMVGMAARVWWLRRKWSRQTGGDDLETEYHVVERHIEHRSRSDDQR